MLFQVLDELTNALAPFPGKLMVVKADGPGYPLGFLTPPSSQCYPLLLESVIAQAHIEARSPG